MLSLIAVLALMVPIATSTTPDPAEAGDTEIISFTGLETREYEVKKRSSYNPIICEQQLKVKLRPDADRIDIKLKGDYYFQINLMKNDTMKNTPMIRFGQGGARKDEYLMNTGYPAGLPLHFREPSGEMLSTEQWKGFWIKFGKNAIYLGKEGSLCPMMILRGTAHHEPIRYLKFRTWTNTTAAVKFPNPYAQLLHICTCVKDGVAPKNWCRM